MASLVDNKCVGDDDEVIGLTKHMGVDDDYNPFFGQRSDPKQQAWPSSCRTQRPPPCHDYHEVAKRMKLPIKVPSPVEFTRNPSIDAHRPLKKYPPAFRLPTSIAYEDEPFPPQGTTPTLLEALTL